MSCNNPRRERVHLMSRDELRELVKEIVMTAAQDAVDVITAQLDKAKGEILTEIANLEAAVAAGQTPNLDALKAAAQSLDDVVPDVVTPPVDVPPVDVPPVDVPPVDVPPVA